jgi:subfamily B ATP-binding cassette protein MsbA
MSGRTDVCSLSVICAVIVSAFWALNLSIAFPVVKVLFQNNSLHDYVERKSLYWKRRFAKTRLFLIPFLKSRSRSVRSYSIRASEKSRNLLMLTKVRRSVLPYVPEDKFDAMALILGVLLAATFLKGLFIYFQEMLVGSVVQLTVNSIRQDCFRSALRLDYQSLNRIGTASLMSRMTNDIEQMTSGDSRLRSDACPRATKGHCLHRAGVLRELAVDASGHHRCAVDGFDLQSVRKTPASRFA